MNGHEPSDDPRRSSAATRGDDPLAAWDEQRRRCPVTHDGERAWSVHGNPEVRTVLLDHETFSNRVSGHLSVPNGMDPPEHGRYRRIVDRYFTPVEMRAFEPACRRVGSELIEAIRVSGRSDAVTDLGEPFAARIQCAFMGWSEAMAEVLRDWQEANRRATRAGDAAATAAVAETFDRHVVSILDRRRARLEPDEPARAAGDPTDRLLRERVDGRPLSDDEIVSIVRNWTVGELGTIAASVGIVVHALAHDPDLQARLRAEPKRVAAANDEALRVRGPLIANRRVATRDVELAGQPVRAGDRVRVLWPSANRDERVFEAPDEIRLDRSPHDDLLYGAGVHVCPGAPLARLELRVLVEELLARTRAVEPDPERSATFAKPPQGGFERVPFRCD